MTEPLQALSFLCDRWGPAYILPPSPPVVPSLQEGCNSFPLGIRLHRYVAMGKKLEVQM